MTVRELLLLLQDADPDAVIVTDDDHDYVESEICITTAISRDGDLLEDSEDFLYDSDVRVPVVLVI